MPFIYSTGPQEKEKSSFKGKDYGVSLDIGGQQQVKDMRLDEQFAKKFGAAITDTVQSGVAIGTKIPVVSDVVKGLADSPIGWTVGKAFDALNVPSTIAQNIGARFRLAVTGRESLPDDVRRMLDSGRSADEVADYMVNSQRAFADDAEANLVFTMLLDPLNFTPLALAKVNMLSAAGKLGKAGTAAAAATAAAPLGIPGVLGGAYAGWKLAGKAGAKIAERTKDLPGMPTGLAGPTRIELGAASKAEQVIAALSKPRGLNLGTRIPAGARNIELLARHEDEIAQIQQDLKAGPDLVKEGRLAQLNSEVRSTESAMRLGNDVTNGFSLGLYHGLVGGKNVAGKGVRALAGALYVPHAMAIPRALGGEKFNKVLDSIVSSFAPEQRAMVEEAIGNGASDIAKIATARTLANPEIALSNNIAEATMQRYFEARKTLGDKRAVGRNIDSNLDEITQEMINNSQATGGVNKNFRVSDTPEGMAELKLRVKVIIDTGATEATQVGRSANPAKMALSAHIQNNYMTNALVQMSKQPGGVAKRVVDTMRELGPEALARMSVDETERLISQMTSEITSRARAEEMYMSRMRSITATTSDGLVQGKLTAVQEAAHRNSFEEIFGDLFDSAGNLKNDEAAKDAAKAMIVADMAGFTSANKVASKVNEALRKFVSPTPEQEAALISEMGEQAYREARAAAQKVGEQGIQLVREDYLFQSVALALKDVYDHVDELTARGRESVPMSVENRAVIGQSTLREYAGNAEDVASVKRYIGTLMTRGKGTNGGVFGDSRVMKVAKKLNAAIAKAETLDDVRVAWRNVAIDASSDLRTTFENVTDPARIRKHLGDALENGWTTSELTASQHSAIKKVMEAAGINPQFANEFSGSRYSMVSAPSTPYHRINKLVSNPMVDDATKQIAWQTRVAPFVDMTSKHFDEVGQLGQRYSANVVQEFMTTMFSPIGSNRVTNNVRARMASYMARGGISNQHIERVMDEIVYHSIQDSVSARGLQREKMDLAFKNAFDSIGGFGAYDRFKETWSANLAVKDGRKFSAVDAIMYAFNGDIGVVGATQKLTGRMKRWYPAMAGITDRLYPNLRFKNNPLYWVQEYFESETLNTARGVDKDVLKALNEEGKMIEVGAAEVRDLARVGPNTHELVDNVSFLGTFRNQALERAITGDWSVPKISAGEAIKSMQAGDFLAARKEIARDSLAADIASKNFVKELADRDPALLNVLISHYGTSDAQTLFVRYMDGRRKLQDVEMVLSDIQASRPAGMGWRRIPDQKGQHIGEARLGLLGGIDPVTGDRILPEDIFNSMHSNPAQSAQRIDMIEQRLIDAGYEPSMFSSDFGILKSNLNRIRELQKKNPGFGFDKEGLTFVARSKEEAIALGETRKAYANVKKSFEKIDNARAEVNLRAAAIKALMGDSIYSVGGQLTFEGTRIAEALALGHTYGADIADFTGSIQRIVENAKAELGSVAKSGDLSSADLRKALTESVIGKARAAAISDPRIIDLLDNANYSLLAVHGKEEKIFKAFEHVYEKALRQANVTTYFNPERSLFERSINHPFLGFYPYSYMFKKILPEMIEFLFKRPFGAQAPGAGYQAYRHARDYFEQQMETDSTFREYMENNDEVAFMATQLFPGVPWDVSALPPAYLRRIMSSTVGGRDKDYNLFADLLARDVIGSVAKIGPTGAGENVLGAYQQILDELGGKNKPKDLTNRIGPAYSDYLDITGRR